MVFLTATLLVFDFVVVLAGFIFTGRISVSDSSFPVIPPLPPSICSLFFGDNSEVSDDWGSDGNMEAGKLTCCCCKGAKTIKKRQKKRVKRNKTYRS